MLRLFILLLFFSAMGCGTGKKDYDYKSYPFNQKVIARLPLYDSIAQVLLQNFPALQKEMKEHSSFDYGFSASISLVNPELPNEAAEKINRYRTQLGDQMLTEFSVYKDSSIKFSIRETELKGYNMVARERLSYLPNGGNMQRREAPDKDTALNANWQYWIDFHEKGLF